MGIEGWIEIHLRGEKKWDVLKEKIFNKTKKQEIAWHVKQNTSVWKNIIIGTLNEKD